MPPADQVRTDPNEPRWRPMRSGFAVTWDVFAAEKRKMRPLVGSVVGISLLLRAVAV